MAGYSGFDFVMIDMEHTSTDFIIAEQMVLAAKASNIVPGIRVPENRPTHILRALEIGAEIIDVPWVNTRAEAASVVRSGKYFPLGERGCAPITRGNLYGSYSSSLNGVGETLRRANEETMLMVQIETREGVENVDEISSTDYIDIIFIGPADLSQSLGIPGEYDNPIFDRAVKKVIRATRDNGKFAGIFVIGGAEVGRKWVDEGAQLLTPFADSYQIYLCWQDVMADYESAVKNTTVKVNNPSVKPAAKAKDNPGNPNYDWFDVI
jgi:4-hydroxy-2-oxoheptanedioate aldolase